MHGMLAGLYQDGQLRVPVGQLRHLAPAVEHVLARPPSSSTRPNDPPLTSLTLSGNADALDTIENLFAPDFACGLSFPGEGHDGFRSFRTGARASGRTAIHPSRASGPAEEEELGAWTLRMTRGDFRTTLRELRLSRCGLRDLDFMMFCDFSALEVLDVSGNEIVVLPDGKGAVAGAAGQVGTGTNACSSLTRRL